MSAKQPDSALDFKSATLYAVRLVLRDAKLETLQADLEKRMADVGALFENEPVVIDASGLDTPLDWPGLVKSLREHRLPPIGFIAEAAQHDAARAAGLVPVDLSPLPAARPASSEAADAAAAPVPHQQGEVVASLAAPADTGDTPAAAAATGTTALQASRLPAMVLRRPLRSGQRVYARHSDLVIIGMVSSGAEIIADGNIHVYGPLRGKAMAGARGDTSARIFATQLDPELIAIAGIYRVVEEKLPSDVHNKPASVSLDDETLTITPI
ncbi:septum site-determining protein MinC [Kerstersia similis]|uniref:septum site-determining protein MinC n=1 Tax=Kerstersia similis TaxID=206505 RepID=UPI0039F0CC2F